MKANAFVFLAAMVTAWGAVLPEVTEDKGATQPTPNSAPAATESKSPSLVVPSGPTDSTQPKAATDFQSPKPSPAVADVVKLIRGGVDPRVVETYVQNSHIAYYPSAEEVLYLRESGVSAEIIRAMLQRGNEVRAQQAQAFKENQERLAPAATVVAPPAAANPSVVVVQSPQPAPQPSSPTYIVSGYPAYSYSYASPFYYDYGWPSYSYRYWPTFSTWSSFRTWHPLPPRTWRSLPPRPARPVFSAPPPSRPGGPGGPRPGFSAPPRSSVGPPSRSRH